MTELEARARRDLGGLDRRTFLKLVGWTAAAGALPSGCGGVSPDLAPPAGLSLRLLTPRTYAVLTAAAARVAGPPAADLVGRRLIEPGRNVETFLAGAPELGATLRQALLALEFGVPPLIGKLRPFTALDERSRDAVLAELRDSRIELKRLIFRGVKSVALLGVYAGAASYRTIGYPGPDGLPGVAIADAMRPLGED